MKIPYGIANFAKIRREGYFYVDKTPFLPLLESAELGYNYLVLLRPRRMGKSALISMMEHYYDISRAADFDRLFGGLWAHEHPTPLKNSYLVLSLDYSQVASDGDSTALAKSYLEATRSAVITLVMRYQDRFPALARIGDELSRYSDAGSLLSNLCGIVAALPSKLYVMIDEYDTFANSLLSAGASDLYLNVTDKAGFVRTFYRTLKAGTTSGAVDRIFITGASPILLDDVTSGFNIATIISLDPQLNELTGFSRANVERALDELLAARPALTAAPGVGDREELLGVLERYYNGYRFSPDATTRVFNSDMVLYFLRALARDGEAPPQMLDINARVDASKLQRLWMATGHAFDARKAIFERVLREGSVFSKLIEQFGRAGPSSDDQFISLLYYTGMLTLSAGPRRGQEYRFEIPNRVVRELGWSHYGALLEEQGGVSLDTQPLRAALNTMAVAGVIEPFVAVFHETIVKAVGLKDLRQFNEKALKMMLLTCFVITELFNVISEKEFAQGFCDLFVSPKPTVPGAKFAWMLELKFLPATATAEDREAALSEAETQLARYTSDAELVPMVTQGKTLKAGTLLFISSKEAIFRPSTATRGLDSKTAARS